jgi:hypothetical protein
MFDPTRAKYCSKDCQKKGSRVYDKSLPFRVELTCPQCSKKFIVPRSKAMRKYCSRACKKLHWAKGLKVNTGLLDLTGQVFGRLTVIERAGHVHGNHTAWVCRCSCPAATQLIVASQALRSGRTKSCGCFARREGIPKPETKVCTKCHKEKPYTSKFFGKKPGFRWGLMATCKSCFHPLARKYSLVFRSRLKYEVLSHYSGGGKPSCQCCGVSDSIHFLTLDHINDDGKEDRKLHGLGITFYAKMKRLNYPNHVRVLCWSCNLGRRLNGGICPHKQKSV